MTPEDDAINDPAADAGEYVLGTLDAAAKAAFETRMARDITLQAEVHAWQDRLLPLAVRLPAQVPDAKLWSRIEASIDAADAMAQAGRLPRSGPVAVRNGMRTGTGTGTGTGTDRTANASGNAAANDALWRRLRRWQALGVGGIAATVLLAVALVMQRAAPTDAGPRYVALLQSPDRSASWVMEIGAGKQMRLTPVTTVAAVPAGKSAELWTKPEGAAKPTSLGLIDPTRVTVLPVSLLPALGERQLFEITLEPPTGSPTGGPTGPIVSVGRSIRL